VILFYLIVTVCYDEIDAKQSWGIIDLIKKRIDKEEKI